MVCKGFGFVSEHPKDYVEKSDQGDNLVVQRAQNCHLLKNISIDHLEGKFSSTEDLCNAHGD